MEAPGIWVTTNEEYEGVAQRDRDEADRLSGHAWTQMYHTNRTFMVRLPVQYLHQVLLDAEPISVGTQDGGPWGYVRLPQLHERLSDLPDIAGSAMNQLDHEQATGSMGGRMPSSSATASFDQGSNSHSYGRDPALLAVDQASQTNGMQRMNDTRYGSEQELPHLNDSINNTDNTSNGIMPLDPALSNPSQALPTAAAPGQKLRRALRKTRYVNDPAEVQKRQGAQAKLGGADTTFRAIFDPTIDPTFSPTWMEDNSIAENSFHGLVFDHVSMKWDVLTGRGVLQVGDTLRIAFTAVAANSRQKFIDAEILPLVRADGTRGERRFPDIQLEPAQGGQILYGCKGPTSLLAAVNHDYAHLGHSAGYWQIINVLRNGRDLGTVHKLRAAWSRWCELYHIYVGDAKYPTVKT